MAEDFPRVHADPSTVALAHIGERNQLLGKESAKGKTCEEKYVTLSESLS